MELHGLERCLGRLFPSHELVVVPERLDERNGPFPFNGFTSSSIPTPLRGPSDPSTTLTKLVQAMAGELERGRSQADLCIVLDDLELANVDRPQRVVDAIRHEVRLHLQALERRSSTHADRMKQALLERGSFHFAVPMIEAWLFADPCCASIVGIPSDRRPRLIEHRNPEDFSTDDQRRRRRQRGTAHEHPPSPEGPRAPQHVAARQRQPKSSQPVTDSGRGARPPRPSEGCTTGPSQLPAMACRGSDTHAAPTRSGAAEVTGTGNAGQVSMILMAVALG
jgi:hypothetical protein